jgi:hypothetical protein
MDNVLYERCLRCGRKLKTEESKLLGYGKTCRDKMSVGNGWKELFPSDVLQKMSVTKKE